MVFVGLQVDHVVEIAGGAHSVHNGLFGDVQRHDCLVHIGSDGDEEFVADCGMAVDIDGDKEFVADCDMAVVAMLAHYCYLFADC